MIYITVTINDNEWTRIRDAASRFWPDEHIDTYLSRNETCRRFILGAVEQLRQEIANNYRRPMNPPADNDSMLRLPGAPR